MKIEKFSDLIAWQKAHALVLAIYRESKDFPREEAYGLTNQIRRASVSVSSCIAEGFSRGTSKDKIQFYRMALGSLTEVQSQIMIGRDIHYLDENISSGLLELSEEVQKLICGLIKAIKG